MEKFHNIYNRFFYSFFTTGCFYSSVDGLKKKKCNRVSGVILCSMCCHPLSQNSGFILLLQGDQHQILDKTYISNQATPAAIAVPGKTLDRYVTSRRSKQSSKGVLGDFLNFFMKTVPFWGSYGRDGHSRQVRLGAIFFFYRSEESKQLPQVGGKVELVEAGQPGSLLLYVIGAWATFSSIRILFTLWQDLVQT